MNARIAPIPNAMKAVVAVLFAALFFFGMQPPAAHAAAPVTVTIKVSSKAGVPLAGVNVSAYPILNHAVVGARIDANYLSNGTYSFTDTGVPATTTALQSNVRYAFYFDAPASATTSFDQFWGGTTFVEEARYWDYAVDGTALDVTLATNSTFTGKVTGTSSKALSGVAVYPWRFDGNGWFRLDEAKVLTSSTGVYTMRNLEPGTYRLQFVPSNTTGYLSEFSGNTAVAESAAALTLGLGATVTSNAGLAVGGSISGSVKLHSCTAAPSCFVQPEGITAYAFTLNPDNVTINTQIAPFASRQTTTSGKWTIAGLPTGKYKVKLRDTFDPDAPEFVDKWAKNADQSIDAQVYNVVAGKSITESTVATLPFYLDTADTSLELTITDHSAQPIGDDTEVYIVSTTANGISEHFILQGGSTYFPFLPVGDYDVYVDPHDGVNGPYIGTQHIASATANTWTIQLAVPGSFTYSAAATVNTHNAPVGTAYSVNPGHTTFDDGSGVEQAVEYSYIWLREEAPIFGAQSATSDSYTSRGVDFGHKITVIVRADTFGYAPIFTPIVVTGAVTQGPAPTIDAGDPPVVTGPAVPVTGSVLTAKPGTWSMTGLTYGYQWFIDGDPIAGATDRTYTVLPGDAYYDVTVKVTASKPGYAASAVVPAGNSLTIGTLAAPKQTKAATFTVTAITDGIRLTAKPGTWSPTPTSYNYLWRVGGVEYFAGTGSSNTYDCVLPACPSAGLAVELGVSTIKAGYAQAAKGYVVRKGTTAPEIDTAGFVYDFTDGGHPSFDNPADLAQVGHTLRVSDPVYSYPGTDDGTLARTYQWQRMTGSTWANISKATKVTYVPVSADVNHQLRVTVTTTSTLYPTAKTAPPLIAGTGALIQTLAAGTKPTIAVQGSNVTGTTKRAVLTGSWAVPGVTQTYAWYRCFDDGCPAVLPTSADWTAIPGAKSATYVPTSADDGYLIGVVVTAAKSGYASAKIASAGFGPLTASNLDTTSAFTAPAFGAGVVSGQARVGRAVTVIPASVDRTTGVTRSYDWLVCTDAACSSASIAATTTTPTLVPSGSFFDGGGARWLKVRETVLYQGLQWVMQSTPIVELVPGTNVATKAPSLVPSSGGTYLVARGTWPSGTGFTFAWFDGNSSVANTEGYTLTPGTSPVFVKVTATRTGYDDVVTTLVARKGTFPTGQPTAITPNPARYGDTLEANSFFTPVQGGSVTPKFQWYSGSTAISGKTTNEFVPSSSYVGKALKVKVTLTSPYFTSYSYYTPSITLVSHLAATGAPVIVSSVPGTVPGAKLSADLTTFPTGMTYTYAWQRSSDGGSTWSAAATTSTYTVLTSDVTKQLRLVVVAKRSGWVSTAGIASAPVTVGYAPALALASPLILGGSGKVDSALTVAPAWNTTGTAVTYSWTRNGVTIPGATGTSVTPTASWIGDEVQAHVTATKAGYLTVTVHSNEVQVAAAPAPTSTALTISPAASVGVASTVSGGVWTVAGLTLKYAWYDDVSDPTHASPVATTATYTPTSTHQLVVVVTAKRAGYLDGTVSKTVAVTGL